MAAHRSLGIPLSPHAPELHTAMRMLPLLERGQRALVAYIDSNAGIDPFRRRVLLGTASSISVVTEEDFDANAELCIRHVKHNGVTTHILDKLGGLCVVLAQRIEDW